MIILVFIACVCIAIYSCFIFYITYNLSINNRGSEFTSIQKISVLIPCRNEEKNIAKCLQSLHQQTLSNNQFEVIIIDDFSEDNTLIEVEKFREKLSLKVIENTIVGKKNALSLGILNAENNIIQTTDADCEFDKNWLQTMLVEFESKQLNMLCGFVNFKGFNNAFNLLQQAESAAIVGISASMLNCKKPATCNGASLMFRKDIFNTIGGYATHKDIATGDDDLLMHAFFKYDSQKVAYTTNADAMAYTLSCNNFMLFLKQRSRWLAKKRYYIYNYNSYLQMLVFIHLVAFYFLFFYSLCAPSFIAFTFIIIKYFADVLYGLKLKKIFQFKLVFIVLMPFYQLYIFIVLIYAQFNTIEWKGRLVQNTK